MSMEWIHTVLEIAGVAVVIWGYKFSDRRERERIREETQEKQREQHQQNQQKLNDIINDLANDLDERPSHLHVEAAGTLNVAGIRYSPKRRIKD